MDEISKNFIENFIDEDIAEGGRAAAHRIVLIAAVDDQHEHGQVFGLTDGRARLEAGAGVDRELLPVQDERRAELDRVHQLLRRRVPLGEFKAYETESGLPVEELTAANCGPMLLGVEQTVFRRAGFIRFSDLPVTQDEALRRRLNALVTTGDDSGCGSPEGWNSFSRSMCKASAIFCAVSSVAALPIMIERQCFLGLWGSSCQSGTKLVLR